MAHLIDGKAISKQIKDDLQVEVAELKAKGILPCLAVIQVGNDPASSVYVNNKKKACEYIGIDSLSYELEETTTESALLMIIIPFWSNIHETEPFVPRLPPNLSK